MFSVPLGDDLLTTILLLTASIVGALGILAAAPSGSPAVSSVSGGGEGGITEFRDSSDEVSCFSFSSGRIGVSEGSITGEGDEEGGSDSGYDLRGSDALEMTPTSRSSESLFLSAALNSAGK